MKLEETENLKLQYVNNIQTIKTQINTLHKSEIDLSEKISEILNTYEKNPNFKGKPSFKNGGTIAEDTDIALLNTDKNYNTTRINNKSTRNQYMKIDQNFSH